MNLVVDPQVLDRTTWTVEGAAFHHLFRVRRAGVGSRLRLVDGQGHARGAVVVAVEAKRALLELGESVASGEGMFSVEVAVSPIRFRRARWMVEKLTEVGVGTIKLYRAKHTQRGYSSRQVDKLRLVAREAVEQCGRSCVPKVEEEIPFATLVASAPPNATFVLHRESGNRENQGGGELWQRGRCLPARAGVSEEGVPLLVVGPEGGLVAVEVEALVTAGAKAVSLPTPILRTETAAVVGAAALQCRLVASS